VPPGRRERETHIIRCRTRESSGAIESYVRGHAHRRVRTYRTPGSYSRERAVQANPDPQHSHASAETNPRSRARGASQGLSVGICRDGRRGIVGNDIPSPTAKPHSPGRGTCVRFGYRPGCGRSVDSLEEFFSRPSDWDSNWRPSVVLHLATVYHFPLCHVAHPMPPIPCHVAHPGMGDVA